MHYFILLSFSSLLFLSSLYVLGPPLFLERFSLADPELLLPGSRDSWCPQERLHSSRIKPCKLAAHVTTSRAAFHPQDTGG